MIEQPKGITLSFDETTPFPRERAVELATLSAHKYSLSPEGRLSIRMKDQSTERILDEILKLI